MDDSLRPPPELLNQAQFRMPARQVMSEFLSGDVNFPYGDNEDDPTGWQRATDRVERQVADANAVPGGPKPYRATDWENHWRMSQDYAGLGADIYTHGVQRPVVYASDGQGRRHVIDGHHRVVLAARFGQSVPMREGDHFNL